MNFDKKIEMTIVTNANSNPKRCSKKKNASKKRNPINVNTETVKKARSALETTKSQGQENVAGVDFTKLHVDIWEKKICLKVNSENFPIPSRVFTDPLWNIEELQRLKSRLNETKSHIDTIHLEPWHRHTREINTAGEVIPLVRRLFKPEFGSQAWCKFYECLSTYPIIPLAVIDQKSPLFSVHLCEAPGAFISATNHFIRSNFPNIQWDWLATTLNPHHEGNDVGSMINEDRLILSSLQNWTFLKDDTGNIMSEHNIDFLIQQVQQKFKNSEGQTLPVGLVTADGSIDCQSNPMEQEAMVSHLHFAEIVAALHILGDGGTFVIKIFTFLECQTISHLYLLCSLFEEVHLFKPATSKEGNSEVYVVCLRYLGKHRFLEQLTNLKKSVGAGDNISQNNSLLPKCMVDRNPFYCRLSMAAKFFTEYQMSIITRNIQTYMTNDSAMYFCYGIIKTEVAQEWINRFNVIELQKQQRLFGRNEKRIRTVHVDKRNEIGTFLDKIKRNTAGFSLKMQFIKEELRFFKTYGQATSIRTEIIGNKDQIRYQRGKPYDNILSSRFCFGKLLLQRQELRIAVKSYESILKKDLTNNIPTSICKNCSELFLMKEISKLSPDIQKATKKDDWKLHRLCFHETLEDLYFTKDINTTRSGLSGVLRQLNFMQMGHSLFLCEFPLLTRLHVGLLYVFSSIFEKVVVCINTSKTMRGVMFHNFIGMKSVEDGEWLKELAHAVMDLDGEKESVVLQIIPTEILANMDNYDYIFEYNLYNTAANLEEIIDKTKKILELRAKNTRTT